MALSPGRTRDLLARECHFPSEHDAVIEAVGDVSVTSPNGDDTDVETVLQRSDTARFETVDELHCTLMANLGAEHVGRQRYDDRSSSSPRHGDEVSF